MADRKEKRGLGRGLSALMADVAPAPGVAEAAPREDTTQISIDRILPNPDQPRRSFDDAALKELAQSIRQHGVIQPLILRPVGEGYQIVAGERRWRAAQIAQLHDVPALVRDLSDTDVLEIAIIENVQRADLNPMDEALGYDQLITRFNYTQAQLAEALGKSRSHIANMLRLTGLPGDVQALLVEGALSAGHGRALLMAHDPSQLAAEVVRRGLSVRQTEALVKADQRRTAAPARPTGQAKEADTQALENDLSAALSMRVVIDHPPGQEAGKLTVRYASLDQLDDLCRRLSVSQPAEL